MYSKSSKRMAKYKILIKESAIKELENVPKKSLKQIIKRIESLSDNPRPKGSQKLSAQERYRIRQGDYRIIYSILDDQATVHVFKIGYRWEVYRS
jgi:mRNA interferase RelE/StbE